MTSDSVTLQDIDDLKKRFDLFVGQIDSAMPSFTEFHCKIVKNPPKNADTENPEELMTIVG